MIKIKGLFCIAIVFMVIAGCENTETDDASKWAKETLANLTLEKKIAQLICTDFSGLYLPYDDPKVETWIKYARDYGIGGFVCYGGTPQNIARLVNQLQKEAEIPILISADFEGGPGQQITGASEFPANMGFAATRDENLMYEAAKIMAEEGRSMGIHLTYTPVTDVSISPDNPRLSVRSFGGDFELMNKLLKAYTKGYKEVGMLTTAKHFPGSGDVVELPGHQGFVYVDKTAEAYEQNEQKAFQYAVDAGVDFIMTEHIAVPSVTENSILPASVEPKLVKGIIREKLNFKGIITSDDLWYGNVTARFGAEDVAVKALEAGHDIILKPQDPVAVIKAVSEAVQQGRVSIEQIDESVYKLLYQKAKLGLHKNRFVDEEKIWQVVGTVAHQAVVKKVADRSVTLLRNENVFPLKNWDPAKTVHITIQASSNQPNVSELSGKMATAFPGIANYSLIPNIGPSYYDAIEKAVEGANTVILSFFVPGRQRGNTAPIREKDLELLNKILKKNASKTIIAMSYGNPHLINKLDDAPAFLVGYGEGGWFGNQSIYFDSFIDVIKGQLSPSGKLPVAVSEKYPIGFGLTY